MKKPKCWYAVHVLMVVHFKDGVQDNFPVWENVYLINAMNSDEAATKAEAIGRENEGDSSGSFSWGEHPAEWHCRGVRKIIEIANSNSVENIPSDGAEITYQTLEFKNEQALTDFLSGKAIQVKIID